MILNKKQRLSISKLTLQKATNQQYKLYLG